MTTLWLGFLTEVADVGRSRLGELIFLVVTVSVPSTVR
jgi:hypothetical protein